MLGASWRLFGTVALRWRPLLELACRLRLFSLGLLGLLAALFFVGLVLAAVWRSCFALASVARLRFAGCVDCHLVLLGFLAALMSVGFFLVCRLR